LVAKSLKGHVTAYDVVMHILIDCG